MTYPPLYDEDPGTPTHRSRPSVITNASVVAESTITYGSLMSRDGFARLSQFPPPPGDVPYTPVEEILRVASPVASEYSMKSGSSSATVRRALPIPPPPAGIPSVAPLNIQRKVSSALPASVTRPPIPGSTSEISSPGPSLVPSVTPPSATLSNTPSSYPSPHDWHDGSSSIANDPYGEDALPTSFITTLLSSMAQADEASESHPPVSFGKQRTYEPSVVSNALTVDSTITYPPPKLFPPLLPPPLPTHPAVTKLQPHIRPPLAGRSTPETLTSFDSSDTGFTLGQTTKPSTLRSMSTSPSLQSLNSSTPLIPQTFAQGDPILEEEEPRTTAGSGPSTPAKSRSSRHRRASTAYSSKSAKSYVSSLVARLSHSSGDRKSIKQAAVWFRKKPLPPVPPLPNIPFQEIRKAEDALPLPDLVNRAHALEEMLDNGQRPYDSESMFNREVKLDSGAPLDPTVRVGQISEVWNSGADPNCMHAARGRKGRSGDFTQQFGRVDSPPRRRRISWSTLTQRQRIIALLVFMATLACVTVAIAVGVIAGGKKPHVRVCQGAFAGVACNLGKTSMLPEG